MSADFTARLGLVIPLLTISTSILAGCAVKIDHAGMSTSPRHVRLFIVERKSTRRLVYGKELEVLGSIVYELGKGMYGSPLPFIFGAIPPIP